MVHYNKCPVCYSSEIRPELNCIDHFKSGELFAIWNCSVCGLSFTQDHPDENSIGHYYESDDYISHNDSSKGLINNIYKLARKMMLVKKRELAKKVTGLERGTILDIGSGTGHFAAVMNKSGWRVKGIEINEKARNASVENFGLEILAPEKIPSLRSNSFDCITLWHVLEHFQDPDSYLTEIQRLLKPGGTTLVAVPNNFSYDAKHYGQYWAAFDIPRHLWHFNPDSFSYLCRERGFRIVNIKPLPLDVFYISILSEKYKGNWMAFLTGLIKGLYFTFMALFNKNRSSSVIYTIRKEV